MAERYRYRDLKATDGYYEPWRRFAFPYALLILAAVCLLAAFPLAVDQLRRQVFGGYAPFVEGVALTMVWAGFLVMCPALVMAARFRCPRCGEHFLRGEGWRGRCEGCGLPLWAPDDPDRTESSV